MKIDKRTMASSGVEVRNLDSTSLAFIISFGKNAPYEWKVVVDDEDSLGTLRDALFDESRRLNTEIPDEKVRKEILGDWHIFDVMQDVVNDRQAIAKAWQEKVERVLASVDALLTQRTEELTEALQAVDEKSIKAVRDKVSELIAKSK